MTKRFRIENNSIYEYDKQLTWRELCDKLNDLEEIRLRKNKELKKFRDKEEKYQSVIGGVIAFLQLYVNGEIWSDLND